MSKRHWGSTATEGQENHMLLEGLPDKPGVKYKRPTEAKTFLN
jgi:hypothetical protein